MLAFCRAEYGAVHLWRGQWTDAEEMLFAFTIEIAAFSGLDASSALAGEVAVSRRGLKRLFVSRTIAAASVTRTMSPFFGERWAATSADATGIIWSNATRSAAATPRGPTRAARRASSARVE